MDHQQRGCLKDLYCCSIGDVKKWLASSTVACQQQQTINTDQQRDCTKDWNKENKELRPSTLINRGTALRTGTRRTKSKLLAFSNRELRPLGISSKEFGL